MNAVANALGYKSALSVGNRVRAIKKKYNLQITASGASSSEPSGDGPATPRKGRGKAADTKASLAATIKHEEFTSEEPNPAASRKRKTNTAGISDVKAEKIIKVESNDINENTGIGYVA